MLAAAVAAGAVAVAVVIAMGQPTDAPTPRTSPGATPSISGSELIDSTTTGVPVGTELRPSKGIVVTRDRTVIEGLEVEGEIIIAADDVVVRNTRVATDTSQYPIHVEQGVTGVLIEHVEIDNLGGSGIGIHFDGGTGTVRYVDIHSAEDGIRISADNVTVESSFIHDLARTDSSHNDAIQIRRGDNVTIRNNNLQAYNARTDDPMNAAIQIGSLHGNTPISDLHVVGNRMNGGNFTVNGGGRGEVVSAVYEDNRFGRDFRYGVVGNLENSRWESTNVFEDNGEFAS